MTEEIEKKEKTVGEDLPLLETTNVFMNDKTGMVWIGIPTKVCSTMHIMLTLDYIKIGIIQFAEQFKKKPSIINPLKEGISNMIGRLGGLKK